MKSSRNSFGMMFLSRFIILQSVVTRYLFVQKVVNCCTFRQVYTNKSHIISFQVAYHQRLHGLREFHHCLSVLFCILPLLILSALIRQLPLSYCTLPYTRQSPMSWYVSTSSRRGLHHCIVIHL